MVKKDELLPQIVSIELFGGYLVAKHRTVPYYGVQTKTPRTKPPKAKNKMKKMGVRVRISFGGFCPRGFCRTFPYYTYKKAAWSKMFKHKLKS